MHLFVESPVQIRENYVVVASLQVVRSSSVSWKNLKNENRNTFIENSENVLLFFRSLGHILQWSLKK